MLSILGYTSTPTKTVTPPIQNEVALSWTNILQRGLEEEDRSAIQHRYLPPENCSLLEAPKLNLEVSSAIREVVARRDKKISDLQNQIGSALSALGQALTSLLKEADQEKNMSLIQNISDASRLLLDFHCKQSKSRRELITIDLKKEVKETLSNVQVDGWLFGDKLGDRIKASKEVERSGWELKSSKPKMFRKSVPTAVSNNIRNLNFRRPLRQQGEYQGGRKTLYHNPSANRQKLSYQQNLERKRGKREAYRPRVLQERRH